MLYESVTKIPQASTFTLQYEIPLENLYLLKMALLQYFLKNIDQYFHIQDPKSYLILLAQHTKKSEPFEHLQLEQNPQL